MTAFLITCYAEYGGLISAYIDNESAILRDMFSAVALAISFVGIRHPVVGVQISRDSTTEATVAIAQSHGRTDIYKSSGQLIRRG